MRTAKYWIDHLGLVAHPEGGFYRETYRASEQIAASALPPSFGAARNFSTAIYFLLRSNDRSLFHRIKSDELWHYHAGGPLNIYVIGDSGLTVFTLGASPDAGESLQVVIPANTWFGAKVKEPDSYTLAGCTVAPGFDFNDFELADRDTLVRNYPDCEDIIRELTV